MKDVTQEDVVYSYRLAIVEIAMIATLYMIGIADPMGALVISALSLFLSVRREVRWRRTL